MGCPTETKSCSRFNLFLNLGSVPWGTCMSSPMSEMGLCGCSTSAALMRTDNSQHTSTESSGARIIPSLHQPRSCYTDPVLPASSPNLLKSDVGLELAIPCAAAVAESGAHSRRKQDHEACSDIGRGPSLHRCALHLPSSCWSLPMSQLSPL